MVHFRPRNLPLDMPRNLPQDMRDHVAPARTPQLSELVGGGASLSFCHFIVFNKRALFPSTQDWRCLWKAGGRCLWKTRKLSSCKLSTGSLSDCQVVERTQMTRAGGSGGSGAPSVDTGHRSKVTTNVNASQATPAGASGTSASAVKAKKKRRKCKTQSGWSTFFI